MRVIQSSLNRDVTPSFLRRCEERSVNFVPDTFSLIMPPSSSVDRWVTDSMRRDVLYSHSLRHAHTRAYIWVYVSFSPNPGEASILSPTLLSPSILSLLNTLPPQCSPSSILSLSILSLLNILPVSLLNALHPQYSPSSILSFYKNIHPNNLSPTLNSSLLKCFYVYSHSSNSLSLTPNIKSLNTLPIIF